MAGLIWVLSLFFSVSFVVLFHSPASSDTRAVVTQRLRGRPSLLKSGVSMFLEDAYELRVTTGGYLIHHRSSELRWPRTK